ncbi:MAG: peptidase T [Bacteroidetes bacterium]|jgi:tripeptide aminopeptidase|nr:peptidase T [Bacteroidota bacterium]
MKDAIVNRFLKYVKIDTQSNEDANTIPSTQTQLEFAQMLCEELKEIGLEEVELDENGYIMATIPSNINHNVPVIGFISHIDTSPDMSGKNVKPLIHQKYNGNKLLLNQKGNINLSPLEFPALYSYIGKDLITTDGTTLLGADNKAGVAEIISAAEFMINHPDIKHGKIRIAFTPDEEIGRGADHFDIRKFGADFAYTMDGGEIGQLEFENFNAASAKITIQGRNVHPGTAKNKMVNSMLIATELNGMLPLHEVPSHTEGYEGFYHLVKIDGDVEYTTMQYIIRDHNKEKFDHKKDLLIKIIDHLNIKYGSNTVKLIMMDQYYNMREKIEPVMHIIELAQEAMKALSITPKISPIRGGTDGARLSFKGLPTPNIFTGGHNYHGRYEFIPIQSMVKATEVIVKIAELNAGK